MTHPRKEPAIVLQRMEVIDLPAVAELEAASYPPSEAASRDIIDYRITCANDLCYVALDDDRADLLGFITATSAPDDTLHLTADMMRNHYPGRVLCIHSVVVQPHLRRRGYGGAMLAAYLRKIRDTTCITSVLLLCKPPLVPFYAAVGFDKVGPSPVVHGSDVWIEMSMPL